MKKRFTIMLDTKVIANIKKLNNYLTPSEIRKALEEELNIFVLRKINIMEKYKK